MNVLVDILLQNNNTTYTFNNNNQCRTIRHVSLTVILSFSPAFVFVLCQNRLDYFIVWLQFVLYSQMKWLI